MPGPVRLPSPATPGPSARRIAALLAPSNPTTRSRLRVTVTMDDELSGPLL